MIPKVIHYVWFGDEMPQQVVECIETWKSKMPNFKFKKWGSESLTQINSIYLNEAISSKKWAFAADYIRLFALYNEGGIYLDTDVVVFHPFDRFLNSDVFMGKEDSMHFNNDGYMGSQYLTAHCMGAIAKHPYIKKCLDYYENRHFVLSDDVSLPNIVRYNYVTINFVIAAIAKEYGYNWDPRINDIQRCRAGIVIYPCDYFCGNSFLKKSYCQHLALGSWRDIQEVGNYTTSIKRRLRFYFIRGIRRSFLKHSLALVKIDNFD